jgi:hypothetical protein
VLATVEHEHHLRSIAAQGTAQLPCAGQLGLCRDHLMPGVHDQLVRNETVLQRKDPAGLVVGVQSGNPVTMNATQRQRELPPIAPR